MTTTLESFAPRRQGLMLVLSSPSGTGKTTLARQLLKHDSTLTMSISVTTRPMRKGEINGRDYYFISQKKYEVLRDRGALLEHAKVFGDYYGTPLLPVKKALSAGRDILFDIDWQGTQQLAAFAYDCLVSIFILPPSWEELARRLYSRALDSSETITKRMARAADEMSHWIEYNYIIVNAEIKDSLSNIQSILTAERLKRWRQTDLFEFIQFLQTENGNQYQEG
jgi:guanylate kinase